MDYRNIMELILDENNFTVGGGSSAALAGAMACGLMGMVINLSKGKEFGYSEEQYCSISEQLREYKKELLEACVKDNEAYLLIKEAYKLPKGTEEEKQLRRIAVQNAGEQAANVPMNTAMLNKKIHEIGKALLDHSNPACETDLRAGLYLSQMGINSGKENVVVNLPLIKEERITKELLDQIALL